MYPLISNISLPEAKREVIYFSWYFCLSKRYTLGIMSQRFIIITAIKESCFIFSVLVCQYPLHFFPVWNECLLICFHLICMRREENHPICRLFTPVWIRQNSISPSYTWPSVLLISTNKRRYFYCITVFHWLTVGGGCINDIFKWGGGGQYINKVAFIIMNTN